MIKNTLFDLRVAESLENATHPVNNFFRGLLIVHEDALDQTRSGVSAFEVVFFLSKGRDQNR